MEFHVTGSGGRRRRRTRTGTSPTSYLDPQDAPSRQNADRPPGRPAARSCRDRLVSATPPAPRLGTHARAQQAPHADRDRGRPRTHRLLLGDLPDRIAAPPTSADNPSAGSVAARHARGIRDPAMSNQPRLATLASRQRLPTTNHGPASPSGQSAHISLTRVAHSTPDRHPPSRPHPQPTRPAKGRKFVTPHLTNDSPYQVRARVRGPSAPAAGAWRSLLPLNAGFSKRERLFGSLDSLMWTS